MHYARTLTAIFWRTTSVAWNISSELPMLHDVLSFDISLDIRDRSCYIFYFLHVRGTSQTHNFTQHKPSIKRWVPTHISDWYKRLEIHHPLSATRCALSTRPAHVLLSSDFGSKSESFWPEARPCSRFRWDRRPVIFSQMQEKPRRMDTKLNFMVEQNLKLKIKTMKRPKTGWEN